jgi:crotonobetainyl-CoA:carnitine CoA-transferase CaiB-like acyl-CoA transferase
LGPSWTEGSRDGEDRVACPDLLTDARFVTSGARSTNRDIIMEVIMPVTQQKTSAEWIKLLNDAGVPTRRFSRRSVTPRNRSQI